MPELDLTIGPLDCHSDMNKKSWGINLGLFSWLLGNRNQSKDAGSVSLGPYRSTAKARVKWRNNSYELNAVGESHYQPMLNRICGGHNRKGHHFETDADLVREPNNPYDPNAVAVMIHGGTVAYLPKEQARRFSMQMDKEGVDRAACRAKIVGGWRTNQHDEGRFGLRLALPLDGWLDFDIGSQASIDTSEEARSISRSDNNRPVAAENGPLKGQRVFVWGASVNSDEVTELAKLGAHVMASVGKTTTMVVYVSDDLDEGMQSSAAYKKAQILIRTGVDLRILSLKELRKELDPNEK